MMVRTTTRSKRKQRRSCSRLRVFRCLRSAGSCMEAFRAENVWPSRLRPSRRLTDFFGRTMQSFMQAEASCAGGRAAISLALLCLYVCLVRFLRALRPIRRQAPLWRQFCSLLCIKIHYLRNLCNFNLTLISSFRSVPGTFNRFMHFWTLPGFVCRSGGHSRALSVRA